MRRKTLLKHSRDLLGSTEARLLAMNARICGVRALVDVGFELLPIEEHCLVVAPHVEAGHALIYGAGMVDPVTEDFFLVQSVLVGQAVKEGLGTTSLRLQAIAFPDGNGNMLSQEPLVLLELQQWSLAQAVPSHADASIRVRGRLQRDCSSDDALLFEELSAAFAQALTESFCN